MEIINGFSKMSKEQKLISLQISPKEINNIINQDILESMSENVLGLIEFPLSFIPNVIVNNKNYIIPFTTEESSITAGQSATQKLFALNGGTKCISNSIKDGKVHLKAIGNVETSFKIINSHLEKLKSFIHDEDHSMRNRGGGIISIEILNQNSLLDGLIQIQLRTNTLEAQGANYINHLLELIALYVTKNLNQYAEVIMSILSNQGLESTSTASITLNNLSESFIDKFIYAHKIAEIDPSRSVTHNKGILNGIIAIATSLGQDTRAISAQIMNYSNSKPLTTIKKISKNKLEYSIKIPITVGTIGGATQIHPKIKYLLNKMNSPTSLELMNIMASVGLAQSYAALKALITTGICSAHMKFHLNNIIREINANESDAKKIVNEFSGKNYSKKMILDFFEKIR